MKKNNLQTKKSGFTLIELLVVITIIGILASIVVVNLNSARGKGQDTAIKEQMSQMRAQASLYYDDNYGYSAEGATQSAVTGTCPGTSATNVFGDDDVIRALAALQRNAGAVPTCYLSAGTATVPSQEWAVAVKLRTASSGYWCVDGVGNAIEISSLTGLSTSYRCQ